MKILRIIVICVATLIGWYYVAIWYGSRIIKTDYEVMVELKTDLPLAKYDRAQKPRRKSGERFMVPQSTKLLSRGVNVTSSDDNPIIGKLEMITDGNKEAPDGSYEVLLLDGLQWVQLDLGKTHALYGILVWHYYLPEPFDYQRGGDDSYLARVYQDVVVQISNDPAFKKSVITVFNNDHDNSSGLGKGKDDTYIETSEGRWINPKGVEGRYVRLYSRGHKLLWDGVPMIESMKAREGSSEVWNNYIEVEVYGK